LLDAKHRPAIEARLQGVKAAQNLGGELKWTKITEAYKSKYIAFLKEVFDLAEIGALKFRIMFTQNSNVPTNLDEHKLAHQYFLLYYQLVKHAFGLMHCGEPLLSTRVTVYLDDVPDNSAKFDQFKNYAVSLSTFPHFSSQGVYIPKSEITDVNSHDHVVLQALDVVLGAMQFRLNDKHLDKPEGKRRRAKRTVAARVRSTIIRASIGVPAGWTLLALLLGGGFGLSAMTTAVMLTGKPPGCTRSKRTELAAPRAPVTRPLPGRSQH
jgi:hypothetical protein